MKTQLTKLGLGMILAVLPLMATSVSAQTQWTQDGQNARSVVVNLSDSNTPSAQPSIAKSVHTVALTENGLLNGQVASLDANTKSLAGLGGISVFFVQNGKVVQQAQTQADGSFQVQGLQQGAYSFFAAGKTGFAASGVYVTRRNWDDGNNILNATMASANYPGIQQILQRNVPVEVRQAASNASQAAATSEGLQTTNQVRLINSRLTGQISSLFGNSQNVGGIQIHLIQNDQPIAQVQTNRQGQFIIPDVEPGVYDFVAAGKTAMVVGRFEAIGNSSLMTQVSFRKTITNLEYALTETLEPPPVDDGAIVFEDGANVMMEPSNGSAIEYAGESFNQGCAAGTTGNFSSGPGRRFGGRHGGSGFRRLLLLGGVGGIVGGTVGNPNAQSPVNNN